MTPLTAAQIEAGEALAKACTCNPRHCDGRIHRYACPGVWEALAVLFRDWYVSGKRDEEAKP